VKNKDARVCPVYFFEFIVSDKVGPIIVVALTAHQTPASVSCSDIL